MAEEIRQIEEINIKIAGFAGQGIKGSGEMISRIFTRLGYDIFDYTEYPSLIKGGHNTYEIHASTKKAYCQVRKVDILVALCKNALVFHKDELSANSIVVCDLADEKINIAEFDLPCRVVDVPWFSAVVEAGGERMMANNMAVAVVASMLGVTLEKVQKLVEEQFGKKDPKVLEANNTAVKLGFDFVQKAEIKYGQLVEQAGRDLVGIGGNEAIALGAIAGGLQFYAAYPMSPSTSLLVYLAKVGKDMGIVVKHAEDEIGVANMVIGASFAGARAMIGTSGGGFCYMTEALGFSGVAELPLVVMLSMRPGPALGMPTWTSQADLLFATFASQDEFPRFVFAPGDVQEAFELTRLAMDLSEKYQTLAIILSDKDLSEGRGTMRLEKTAFEIKRHGFIDNPKVDETGFFPRYYPTPTGISYRTAPGVVDGEHLSNSYEHDKWGLSTEEADVRIEQMDKRMRKIQMMKAEILRQHETNDDAQIGLISFGTNKGVMMMAKEEAKKQGVEVNVLNLSWISPFPVDQVRKFIDSHKYVGVVENNVTGQLSSLIAMEVGADIGYKYNRYDGRPIYSEEIVEFINKINGNGSK